MREPVIGWNLGTGSGNAVELPSKLIAIPLIDFQVNPSVAMDPAYTYLDIWGLDPKLDLTVSAVRYLRKNATPDGVQEKMRSYITACLLFGTPEGVEEGAALSTLDLFGVDPAEHSPSVSVVACQLSTAAQGVRFKVWPQSSDDPDPAWLISAFVQARPNVALGCVELADKLVRNITIYTPGPSQTPYIPT